MLPLNSTLLFPSFTWFGGRFCLKAGSNSLHSCNIMQCLSIRHNSECIFANKINKDRCLPYSPLPMWANGRPFDSDIALKDTRTQQTLAQLINGYGTASQAPHFHRPKLAQNDSKPSLTPGPITPCRLNVDVAKCGKACIAVPWCSMRPKGSDLSEFPLLCHGIGISARFLVPSLSPLSAISLGWKGTLTWSRHCC